MDWGGGGCGGEREGGWPEVGQPYMTGYELCMDDFPLQAQCNNQFFVLLSFFLDSTHGLVTKFTLFIFLMGTQPGIYSI